MLNFPCSGVACKRMFDELQSPPTMYLCMCEGMDGDLSNFNAFRSNIANVQVADSWYDRAMNSRED